MRYCFIVILALWIALQVGCLLSLFLHFRSGTVVGTIDGSLAFRLWPPIDYLASTHALGHEFFPKIYPPGVSVAFCAILIVASVPFCASLKFLSQLLTLYSQGEVFSRRNMIVMRRIGHAILATGYSPLLLGPIAHMIGVLKPLTGVTNGMIAFFFVGLILLAISHVMTIGQRLQNELALAVGVTESNLSAIKWGKIKGIRFSTLEAICHHLQCQPGDILEYIPEDDEKSEGLSRAG